MIDSIVIDSSTSDAYALCDSAHSSSDTRSLHISDLRSKRQELPIFSRHCYVCVDGSKGIQYLEWDKAVGRLVARLGRKPIDPREFARAEEHRLTREKDSDPRRLAEIIPTAPEEAAHRLADPAPGPEELAIQADAVRVLSERLPAEEFRLLAMHYGLGEDAAMTQEEIADELGIAQQTVSDRIKSALKSARCVLEPVEPHISSPTI